MGNGITDKCMERENSNGLMDRRTTANSFMEERKVKAHSYSPMEIGMKGIGLGVDNKELAPYLIKMAIY